VKQSFSLIVTDTSPFVHAGACRRTRRPAPPRAAGQYSRCGLHEATRVRGAPGAEQIVEWINAHLDLVRIVPTDIGIDQQRRLEEGRSIRGLGEQAAIEALERFLRTDPAAEALLLVEDSDVEKRRAVVDQRVSLISTGDLLRELEAAGLIQSTDAILDRAVAYGRNVDRQRKAYDDAATRERLRAQLRRDRGGGDSA
jgi:hypothetical protein